jgi:hypothetical protein
MLNVISAHFIETFLRLYYKINEIKNFEAIINM